jgi:drug/metabolite transporter (DMT)-like permease
MLPVLAFAAMAAVWGFTWLPAKLGSEVVPPIFLAGCRFVLAGSLFGVFAAWRRLPLATPQLGRLLASALLITTFCYAPLFWGVARAPTGLSAIINFSLMPIFTIAVAWIWGRERVTVRRAAAIALGIGGLVLLFSTRTGGDLGIRGALGLLGVAVGTLSYAIGAVISRPLMRELSPVALAFWQTLLGGLALLPISFAIEGFDLVRFALVVTHPKAAGSLAFLIIAGSLVGFLIYLWLLREWGAFRAGLYAFVSPAVAVAVGVIWAGEPFGPTEGLGMAVMFAATAMVLRPEPDRRGAS